jgi:hypothetical protein
VSVTKWADFLLYGLALLGSSRGPVCLGHATHGIH